MVAGGWVDREAGGRAEPEQRVLVVVAGDAGVAAVVSALARSCGRAWDVRSGRVFAATPVGTGIRPFTDLAGRVMARALSTPARPGVFVIVDNGSEHRGQAVRDLHDPMDRMIRREQQDGPAGESLPRAA